MVVMWVRMWYRMDKRIRELENMVCVYGRSECLGYDCDRGKVGINGVIDGLMSRLGKNNVNGSKNISGMPLLFLTFIQANIYLLCI